MFDFKPHGATAEDVWEEYARAEAATGNSDPLSPFTEIYGDGQLRHYGVRAAERAGARDQRVFFLDFAVPLAVGRGVPHCAELPFVFGTLSHPFYAERSGDTEFTRAVSDRLMDAFGSFAATGVPSAAGLPEWPAFRRDTRLSLVVGEDRTVGQVKPVVKYDRLRVFDDLVWSS